MNPLYEISISRGTLLGDQIIDIDPKFLTHNPDEIRFYSDNADWHAVLYRTARINSTVWHALSLCTVNFVVCKPCQYRVTNPDGQAVALVSRARHPDVVPAGLIL